MTTLTQVKHLTKTQDDAISAALRYAQHIYDLAKDQPADIQKQLLLNSLPPIAQEWGEVAAEKAASWYDTLRGKTVGDSSFTAAVPDLSGVGDTMAGAIINTASGLYGRDGSLETVTPALNTAIAQQIRTSSRQTVYANMLRDPSKPRYARPANPNACPYCIAASSQGLTYPTADDSHGYHDNCRCQPVPVWQGEKQDEIMDRVDNLTETYYDAQRAAEKELGHAASSKDTINYMRRNNITA